MAEPTTPPELADTLQAWEAPRPVAEEMPKGSVRVVDAATGVERFLPPDEATEAFKSGLVNLPKDVHVGVADPEGELHVADAEAADKAVAAGGALAPQIDAHRAELAREYAGGKGGAIAFGAGAGRGLTFGLSDAAIHALGGDEAAEAVEASDEAHPWLKAGGELGGMALQTALLPGAGLGGLAEEGAAAGLARFTGGALARDAGGLGARMLARGGAMGVRGLVEGAQFGVQDAVSESALHTALDTTPELTGEQLVAGIGHSALMGAVFGSLAGGGTELASAGLRKASSALGSEALDKAASNEMWRDINSAKGVTKKIMGRVEGGTEAIGKTARSIGLDDIRLSPEDQLARASSAKEEAGQALSDLYKRSGATGSAKPLLEKLDTLTKDVEKVAGAENVVAGLKKYRNSLVEKLTRGAEEGPEFVPPKDPREAAFLAEMERLQKAGAPPEQLAELEKQRASIFGERQRTLPRDALEHPVPIGELWEQRKGLDALLKWESTADPDRRVAILRAFRGQFQDYLADIGEKAAKDGEEFAAPLREMNRRYSHLSYIEQAVEEKVARQLTNRRFSLTDSIMQAGGHSGGMAALMAGHPLAAAASMLAGSANKLLRERGPRVAAYLLGHAGGLDAVAKHVQAIDAAIERTATVLAARGAGSALPEHSDRVTHQARTAEETSGDYEKHAGIVRELADHPQLASSLDEHLSDVANVAPKSAAAARATTKAGVAYLAKTLPAPLKLDPMRPLETSPPAMNEQGKWLRRRDAVDNPMALLQQLHSMRLDPITVDAVRHVYPALYAKVQHAVRDKLAESPESVSRADRLVLSGFLGAPLTPSAQTATVIGRQKTFTSSQGPSDGGGQRPAKGQSSKIKIGDAFTTATASEQVEKGS